EWQAHPAHAISCNTILTSGGASESRRGTALKVNFFSGLTVGGATANRRNHRCGNAPDAGADAPTIRQSRCSPRTQKTSSCRARLPAGRRDFPCVLQEAFARQNVPSRAVIAVKQPVDQRPLCDEPAGCP